MAINNIPSTFKRGEVPSPRRIVSSVDGLQKCGKTNFALTAPRPLGFLDLDNGLEGVANKHDMSDVYRANYTERFTEVSEMVNTASNANVVADAATKVWNDFKRDYIWCLENMRTLAVDTGSEMHELIRLARFGKLTQIMPEQYGPVNGELSLLLKRVYKTNCNLILLHRLKPEYETEKGSSSTGRRQPGKKTGRLIRAGFKDIGFLVQVVVRLSKDEDGFSATIEDCRHDPEIEGNEIPEALISFAGIAKRVFPASKLADWK